VEHALPEQFVHSYKNGQFVTSPVSHSGGWFSLRLSSWPIHNFRYSALCNHAWRWCRGSAEFCAWIARRSFQFLFAV